jgi:hypothetical protein
LDEVASSPNPTSEETKQAVKTRGQEQLFLYSSDYAGDIDKAFGLWDAVYKGLQVAGDLFKDRKLFDDADKWLADLR